ncbi:hypothetical protein F7734_15620 [Scytonema sp. UIC 10036]|uniref:hypothetical protein n=1 Tax=Scytonema sp. UIC 10036 TaxID=2304196 RepID=UPI0012DAA8F4|nr:hypothetical protein [Scytonema sp. UIC 10036]MUG93768.1 hypothetical protein [Scytonema sp. UIC 10036]
MQVLHANAPSQEKKFIVECEGFEYSELAGFAELKYAFFLLERKESLSAKEYRALLGEHGKEKKEADKLIKLAKLAKTHGFSAEDLAELGTMMFSLTTPSNALVWEAMKNVEELTQVTLSALQKEVRQTAKASKPASDPRSILKREKGGGKRYGQLAKIHDQELIANLERIFVEDGVSQTQFLREAVSQYQAQRTNQPIATSNTEPLAEPNVHIKKNEIAPETSTSQETIAIPSPLVSIADDKQANTHTKLNIEEQAIATTAALNIPASSDTPLQQIDEMFSSNDAVSESQLERPANEQAVAQAKLNNHIAKPEIDDASLSDSLKKAVNWQEIEQLTECDRNRFAEAVKDWSIEEKQVLVKHLTACLETNSEALRLHQHDWVPLPSLEKAFKNLSFKVRDIQEGLSAPWVSGCQFVSVADFGNDSDEVWIFISPTQHIIEVIDREDFQVVGF